MDDTTFRIEIEKLLVDKEYWRKYDWLNNAKVNDEDIKNRHHKFVV